jgi:hypothetical protein
MSFNIEINGIRYKPLTEEEIEQGIKELEAVSSPIYEFRGFSISNLKELAEDKYLQPMMTESAVFIEISKFVSIILEEMTFNKYHSQRMVKMTLNTEESSSVLFYLSSWEAKDEIEGFYKFRTHIKTTPVIQEKGEKNTVLFGKIITAIRTLYPDEVASIKNRYSESTRDWCAFEDEISDFIKKINKHLGIKDE